MTSVEEALASAAAGMSARYSASGPLGPSEAGIRAGTLAYVACLPGGPAGPQPDGSMRCCGAAGAFRPLLDAMGADAGGRRAFCLAFAAYSDVGANDDAATDARSEAAMRALGCLPGG